MRVLDRLRVAVFALVALGALGTALPGCPFGVCLSQTYPTSYYYAAWPTLDLNVPIPSGFTLGPFPSERYITGSPIPIWWTTTIETWVSVTSVSTSINATVIASTVRLNQTTSVTISATSTVTTSSTSSTITSGATATTNAAEARLRLNGLVQWTAILSLVVFLFLEN